MQNSTIARVASAGQQGRAGWQVGAGGLLHVRLAQVHMENSMTADIALCPSVTSAALLLLGGCD
jgi:hypothetical protein